MDGTSGTDNEIAIFTDSNSIEGDSNLTWDGSTMTVTGDFRVGGTVTAQEFHAEFVSSSIIYESGSTKFGNSYDDYHDFTGSLRVDSTANSHFVGGGNVGVGTNNPGVKLDVTAGTLGTHLRIGGPLRQLSFSTETIASADDLHRLTIGAGAGEFAFSNTTAEIIRFSGDGRIGVGTTNPTGRVDIHQTADTSNEGYRVLNAASD